MKRTIVALLGTILISAVAISAQQKPAPPADTTQAKTFGGCLVPGSSDGSYTLIGVSEKGQKGHDDNRTLKVVPASPKVDLAAHVTQEVEVTGTLSGTVLTATKVSRKSDYCG